MKHLGPKIKHTAHTEFLLHTCLAISKPPGHLFSPTFILCEKTPTQFWKDDEVFCIALWAGHTCRAVAPLLLVHPALQAGLVNPFGRAAAATRTHPLCRAVVLVCGKAHPAAPKNKHTYPQAGWRQWSTYTHLDNWKKGCRFLNRSDIFDTYITWVFPKGD